MKPSSWDKQLGLASPLECAASQSGQTNNPSKECGGAGCKSPYPHLPEGRGEAFFLDILFHRMSAIGILRQQSPAHAAGKLGTVSCRFLRANGLEWFVEVRGRELLPYGQPSVRPRFGRWP